jgi:hypothetical protein
LYVLKVNDRKAEDQPHILTYSEALLRRMPFLAVQRAVQGDASACRSIYPVLVPLLWKHRPWLVGEHTFLHEGSLIHRKDMVERERRLAGVPCTPAGYPARYTSARALRFALSLDPEVLQAHGMDRILSESISALVDGRCAEPEELELFSAIWDVLHSRCPERLWACTLSLMQGGQLVTASPSP